MNKKIPVIIDCDPGLDDVIALLMACSSEKLDVKAVTVVAGNQTLDKVGDNTLRVLDFAGIDVPVAFGFSRPMVRPLVTAPEIHGENGLYGVKLPESKLRPSKFHAIDLMANVIRESKEKVTLIPIGPLTNIAMFLLRYPELKERIERISLMGGAINGGNKTAVAEFNIYVDPEAADIVFKSEIPIMMAGLDVTHKANVFIEDIEKIKSMDNRIGRFVGQMLEGLSKYHIEEGFNGCHLHDPVAVFYVTDPEKIEAKALHVDIELKGEFTTGVTVAHEDPRFNEKPNANVAFNIDREAFVETMINSIMKYR